MEVFPGREKNGQRRLLFLFGIHNHQPLGNFDFVIEHLVQTCYKPFLLAIKDRPFFKLAFHTSGPLLKWFEEHEPSILDLIGTFVTSGRMELLLGGFYEPVLAAIPSEDRRGQLQMMRDYLARRFGTSPTGLWLTERVWEPDIVGDLVDSGVTYVLVDDRHFLVSGFGRDDLYGYYLTEKEGKRLAIFPISEKLRYLIPFRPPEALNEYLHQISEKGGGLAIYVDDGEKFGGWPGTYRWVYEQGWLEAFLDLLEKLEGDLLEMATFSQVLEEVPARGLCYLPIASYMEMEEWALPPERSLELRELRSKLGDEAGRFLPYVRGGHWKHFLVKYPEANRMHKKMLAISHLLKERGKDERAKEELYAAQCNDAYWHGIFGGLYLPHLRHEIWRRLARVEKHLRKGETLSWEILDLDFDGREEVWVHSSEFSSLVRPASGGKLLEHTLFGPETNYLNTLTRRFEAYHQQIREGLEGGRPVPGGGVGSIHELKKDVGEEIRLDLVYDHYERGAFIEHCFLEDLTPERFRRSDLRELGDFVDQPFSYRIEDGRILMERKGHLFFPDGRTEPLHLLKALSFSPRGEIRAHYRITNPGGAILTFLFGVELNLFLLALARGGGTLVVAGKHCNLDEPLAEGGVQEFHLVDQAAPLTLRFLFSKAGTLWGFPVRTVSQSEQGYDRTLQGLAFLPHWWMELRPGESWEGEIRWELG